VESYDCKSKMTTTKISEIYIEQLYDFHKSFILEANITFFLIRLLFQNVLWGENT